MQLTRGTLSRIHFPGSSNNSLCAWLCSDFNLGTLRSCWRTLMFCLNELTVLLDAALQSTGCSPSPTTTTCDNHRACPHRGAPRITCSENATNICQIAAEFLLLLFPAAAYLRRSSLICEAVCEQAALDWAFATLQPCNIHKTKPLCWMYLQGMVFVRVWARQQPPTDFFCCFFPPLLGIKGLHKAQAGNFTESL